MTVGVTDYRRNRRYLCKGGSQPSKELEIIHTPRLATEEGLSSDISHRRVDDTDPHTELSEPMKSPLEEILPTS